MKHSKSLLLFLAVLAMSSVASAADTSTPNTDSLSGITAAINSVVGQNLVSRFVSGGLQISSQLIGYAKIIAGALAGCHILWQVTINIINGKNVLEGVIEDLLFAGVVVFMLSIYPAIVSDVVGLGQQIMNSGASGGIAGSVSNFIGALFGQIAVIVKGAVSSFSQIENIFDFFTKAIDSLIALIFTLFTVVFGIMALAEVLSVVILGPVVIGLSIALGPLFVAMLATSWTRRWFDQWLNFFINGAVLTAILAIILTLISNVLLNQLNSSVWGSSLSGGALAMAILNLSLGKIVSAVPGFADALLPGRTGAGSARTNAKDAFQTAKEVSKNAIASPKTAANLATRTKGAAQSGETKLNNLANPTQAKQ